MSLRNTPLSDIQCFNNAAKTVGRRWKSCPPDFCRTEKITQHLTHNRASHTNCRPHSTYPARVRACILERSCKTTYRMPKCTAYHLKISCRPYNTGIIGFVQVKLHKSHRPETVRRPVILCFWTVWSIRWASRFALTKKSLRMHKSAGKGPSSRLLQRQAYTGKVHARKAQG